MRNQQRKLARLLQENNIENNKQALKAVRIIEELFSEIKLLKIKLKNCNVKRQKIK